MKNESKKTRTECDLLGCVEVPDNVLYGVQTMRGLENFAISKFRLCEYPRFIEGWPSSNWVPPSPTTRWGFSPTNFSEPYRRPAAKSWRAGSTSFSPWI